MDDEFEIILDMPDRKPDSATGSQFIDLISTVPQNIRDEATLDQLMEGNVPTYLRKLLPVDITFGKNKLTYFVTPDYLSIGHDNDFVRMPLSAISAQKIAYYFRCCLPTRKMVIDIWRSSVIRLEPIEIFGAPDTQLIKQHNDLITGQMLGAFGLMSGAKRDVVVSTGLQKSPSSGYLYGFMNPNGTPRQPLNGKRSSGSCDYSMGVRLVSRTAVWNDEPIDLFDMMINTPVVHMVSDEGPLHKPYYDV